MDGEKPISVLFVCHGNICRSPMAEFIFKNLAAKAGVSDWISVSSAATSNEETGNPVYQLAKRTLAIHGIGCRDKVAVTMTKKMYEESDYVVAMDRNNIRNIEAITNIRNDKKLFKLLDFTMSPVKNCTGDDISDPWYTRDFNRAWNDIYKGCCAMLEFIEKKLV